MKKIILIAIISTLSFAVMADNYGKGIPGLQGIPGNEEDGGCMQSDLKGNWRVYLINNSAVLTVKVDVDGHLTGAFSHGTIIPVSTDRPDGVHSGFFLDTNKNPDGRLAYECLVHVYINYDQGGIPNRLLYGPLRQNSCR